MHAARLRVDPASAFHGPFIYMCTTPGVWPHPLPPVPPFPLTQKPPATKPKVPYSFKSSHLPKGLLANTCHQVEKGQNLITRSYIWYHTCYWERLTITELHNYIKSAKTAILYSYLPDFVLARTLAKLFYTYKLPTFHCWAIVFSSSWPPAWEQG